ncbi:glutamine amidotransferase-related protein [Palleronia sp. LCG004]|uniref:glutamine amidotransferase-related protein n=1 Tax=Palleronia sp. LCG004 TaxID=3079304 RepID=UPI002941EABE|nr:gamma-glutamyl-gamma-aminobutyrate hydrolase family protein [Palleronia sp. LCG004]WOI57692.1 gamma-glutamyl-gamma-aminobutyrate hydrolase family protein [Palleronia sp. LCG004]
MPLHVLVVSSETPDQQAARRRRSGMASHETYADTVRDMMGEGTIEHVSCVESGADVTLEWLRQFDGVLFPGSPIQMHEATPEVRRAARFMAAVFEAGVPSFGSCAGLQIAAVAAGGAVKPCETRMEAGFARGIVATEAGRGHPMLRGRPGAWDAPTMHSAVVCELPEGGTVLAGTRDVPVEAAEIRSGSGVFWGVQYHPELALAEIADALRGQSEALVHQGLAQDEKTVERYAGDLDALDAVPERRDLAWQLGLDVEVTDGRLRRTEIANFLNAIRQKAAA